MDLANLQIDTVLDSETGLKKAIFVAKDCHTENLRGVSGTFDCDGDAINRELREAAGYAEHEDRESRESYERAFP